MKISIEEIPTTHYLKLRTLLTLPKNCAFTLDEIEDAPKVPEIENSERKKK